MTLTPEQQEFLVVAWARGGTALHIKEAFEAVYGCEIDTKQVHCYNAGKSYNRIIRPGKRVLTPFGYAGGSQIAGYLIEIYDKERARYEAKLRKAGALCSPIGRVVKKIQRHESLERVIEERAEAGDTFPGAETGLLVKDFKGKDADQLVVRVDTPTLREMSNLEIEIADELGQKVTKIDLGKLENEHIVSLIAELRAGLSGPDDGGSGGSGSGSAEAES